MRTTRAAAQLHCYLPEQAGVHGPGGVTSALAEPGGAGRGR
ncbi:hypothetical protein [Actinoplanes sp. ATCC 53533]|nr:hypothetical protein [Actinoplanes sp. ATCC 53533]